MLPALIELRIAAITFSILYVSFYFSSIATTAVRRVFPAWGAEEDARTGRKAATGRSHGKSR